MIADVKETRPLIIETGEIRATRSAYLVVSLFGGVLLAITLAASLRHSEYSSNWEGPGFALILIAFSLLWLQSFKVILRDNSLSYSTLFGGTKILEISDIKSVKFEAGIAKYLDRFRPPFRIAISYKNNQKLSNVDINTKVFSWDDIHRITSFLKQKGVYK